MKFKTILLFLFVSFTAILQAQNPEERGFVRLRIYGLYKPLCRLDTAKLNTNDTLLSLSPGVHRVRIWEPTLTLIDSSINIKANDTVKYSFMVQQERAFVVYRYNYRNYRSVRNRRLFFSPILVAMTVGLGMYIEQVPVERQYNNALHAKDVYSRSGSQANLDKQKGDFEMYKKKYDNYKKLEYGIYAAAGVLAINYVRILIKQKKVPIPVYKQQDTLLSKVDFNIYPSVGNKNWLCGLIMKF